MNKLIFDYINPDFADGPWIAGGYPLKLYSRSIERHTDIDVFFRNKDQFLYTLDKILNECRIARKNTMVHDPIDVIFQNKVEVIKTHNAITIKYNNVFVQLIYKNFNNSLQDVFDSFDINCCKIATDGVEFIATEATYHDIDHRVLNMTRIHKHSLRRFTKYVGYGYKPTTETCELLRHHTSNPIRVYTVEDGYGDY